MLLKTGLWAFHTLLLMPSFGEASLPPDSLQKAERKKMINSIFAPEF
jgi:hypothetical protein